MLFLGIALEAYHTADAVAYRCGTMLDITWQTISLTSFSLTVPLNATSEVTITISSFSSSEGLPTSAGTVSMLP